jgi:hypothetical protein
VRAPRAWLKRCGPFGFVAFDQLLDPLPGGRVVAGDLAFAAAFDHHRGDDELCLGHGRPPDSQRRQLCRETAVNYVLKSDTVSPTRELAVEGGFGEIHDRLSLYLTGVSAEGR